MPHAKQDLATNPRSRRRNAGHCLLIAWLSACSGDPFSAGGPATAGTLETTVDPATAGDPATADGSGGSLGAVDDSVPLGAGAPTSDSAQAGAPAVAQAGAPAFAATAGADGDNDDSGSGGLADTSAGGTSGQAGGVAGAGAPAAGGSAGTGTSSACNRGSNKSYELNFYPEKRANTEREVHPFFRVRKLKGKPLPLSRLKIRYYYTKEAIAPETGSCFWVTGNHCSLVKFAFSNFVPATKTANRVMELSFAAGGNAIVGRDGLEVRTGFTVNHANLEQNDDYSFAPNAAAPGVGGTTPYFAWDHVTLYVDDALVWGAEPCSN
jgi:hypothetical protein